MIVIAGLFIVITASPLSTIAGLIPDPTIDPAIATDVARLIQTATITHLIPVDIADITLTSPTVVDTAVFADNHWVSAKLTTFNNHASFLLA